MRATELKLMARLESGELVEAASLPGVEIDVIADRARRARHPHTEHAWEMLADSTREMWRKVARAVCDAPR